MAAESRLNGRVPPFFGAASGGPCAFEIRHYASPLDGVLAAPDGIICDSDTPAFAPLKTRFGWLKNTGDKIAGPTGFVVSRSSVFIHFGGPQGHGDSVDDALRMSTGDKIAGVTG